MRLLPRCWRLAVRHDRLGRRAGRPAHAAAALGLDRGGGCAGVGGGLGGDAMKKHKESLPLIYRLAAGMTQEEFAKSLGGSIKTVSRWEAGETQPSLKRERQLYGHCAAYHIVYTCPICEVTR
jgi:DNA-binding XRE family transcriptional regulator